MVRRGRNRSLGRVLCPQRHSAESKSSKNNKDAHYHGKPIAISELARRAHGQLDARIRREAAFKRHAPCKVYRKSPNELNRLTEVARVANNRQVSVTISTIRERNETSQALPRVGNGSGCGLPLLHPGCRG